jgi:hypothetical protein
MAEIVHDQSKMQMQKVWLALLAVFGALMLVAAACIRPPTQPLPPDLPYRDVEVGLSPAESVAWRFTSEGSDLVPVDILRALIDTESGKPFSEALDRFGFLPAAAGPGNPYALPVGWTIDVPDYSLLKADYVGVNCSACHTGEVAFGGQALRIDGAPNMADIEAFALAVEASVIGMLEDPLEAFAFVVRLIRLEPPPGAQPAETFAEQLPAETRAYLQKAAEERGDHPDRPLGEAIIATLRSEEELPDGDRLSAADQAMVARTLAKGLAGEDERHVSNLIRFLRKYFRLLESRAEYAALALSAFKTSTVAGPGRDDPWNIIRNLLFLTPTELDSPVSIPDLFSGGDFDWYHADGNTNSVGQRNVAQAVALGAYVDPKTNESTLKPRNVWLLEDLMRKLKSPAWPAEEFGETGKLDPGAVERGAAIFARKMPGPGGLASCADCHAAFDGTLFPLEVAGTDPNRAQSFLLRQDGKPFSLAIFERVSKIEAFTNKKAGITPEEARRHEYHYPPVWRETGQYLGRKLAGIWATAPYLHNGSVPTLYDLLLPAAQRPATFPLGHREYDPQKVGYRTDVRNPTFVFDVKQDGNSNAGHEFGTSLGEQERWDLVEFLKTQ